MKIWKDKEGKWIDAKEFKQRFVKGVEGITPLQQARSQYVIGYITLIGILCGIIGTLFYIKTLWWLEIILVAALGNSIIAQIGAYQKYIQLKKIDDMIKGGENGL